MFDGGLDTVLFVCDDESISSGILEKLCNAGFGVVGPTPRAATALALAAQTAPTLAVVAGPLTGRRSASELAQDLMTTWGVRSWILTDADGQAADAAEWAVQGEQLERLRQVFA